jgi:hypothetical protein
MATTPLHLNLRRAAMAVAAAALLLPASAASSYAWPLKPFDRQHPVRGFFGDPRISGHSHAIHFGIDVSAPDGTPVYATVTGRVVLERPEVVTIVGTGRTSFEYWHVIPAVQDRSWAIAYRTVVGHVARGWGHVHLAEILDGRYVNPLRQGGVAPYRDHTTPVARHLTVEQDGVPLPGRRASGRVDLVVEASDETPVAVPAPWNAKPVVPAVVRWRVLGASRALESWMTAADFTSRLPEAGFAGVYASWTRQNRPWSCGRYRFVLARGWDTRRLADGRYRIEVSVLDTAGNSGRYVETVAVANGSRR